MADNSPCVVVDLDGTLVRTDLFLEAITRYLRRNLLHCFQLLGWIFAGRHVAKARIAERVDIDASQLPYESEVIDYLVAARASGSTLILATAAPRKFALAVADHLGIFDQVLASDLSRNMKGRHKLAAVREQIGDQPFVYVGDSNDDLILWQAAESGVFVNANRHAGEFRSQSKVRLEINNRAATAASFFRQMRPHQWAKSALVLLPLLVSHSYLDVGAVAAAIMAVSSFCLCSSSVYFLNDLLDLHEDRQHPTKRNRPLAAGDLTLRQGMIGAGALFAGAVTLALFLPALFMIWLLSYFLVSTAYSVYLKKIWAVDTITLAGLYTIRILAGAAAISVVPSFWLLSFSVFAFLGLAYLKRYVEFSNAPSTTYGRGYSERDSESLFSLGTANMTVSVLVMALFIHEADTSAQYATPQLLWCLCVVLMYWSNRIWFKARRGLISDDPVIWALGDRISQGLVLLSAAIVLAARFVHITI